MVSTPVLDFESQNFAHVSFVALGSKRDAPA
jgi:hypothetical protein